jgi:hypothetical protein
MKRLAGRTAGLAALLAAATSACDGPGADRPPLAVTVVERAPDETGAGMGAVTAGASVATGDACWSGTLPSTITPIEPTLPAADSCRLGATATEWSYPTAAAPPAPDLRDADDRGLIVGRWVSCDGAGIGNVPHAGIEFGANGRFQLLTTNAAAELVPMAPAGPGIRGYYYLIGGGQLDLEDENGQGLDLAFAKFAQGMDTLSLGWTQPHEGAIYARTTPSAANGADNAPSTSDGRCSMVGTWDLPANAQGPGAPAAAISFDAAGNFVGGSPGANLCDAHAFYGTYRLSPGLFQLTSNVGMGLCAWWFNAAYPAALDASCTHLTTTKGLDNCTSGRGYFNGTVTLTRRPQ